MALLCKTPLQSEPSQVCDDSNLFDPSVLALVMSSWQQTYPDQEQQQEDEHPFSFPGTATFRIDPSNNEGGPSPFPIRTAEEARTSAGASEFEIFQTEPYPHTGGLFADYQYRASTSALHTMEGLNTRSDDFTAPYASPPNQFGGSANPSPQPPQGSFYPPHAPLYSSPLSSPLPTPFPSGTPFGPSSASFSHFGSSTSGHASPPASLMSSASYPYGLSDTNMMASGDSTPGSSPYSSSDSLSPSVGSTPVSPSHTVSRRRSGRDSESEANVHWVPPQGRKRPRRRADEIDRIYICGHQGCTKGYGTLNHLNAHVKIAGHGAKRRPEEFREIRAAWKRRREQDAAQQRQHELAQASGSHRVEDASAHRHHPSRGVVDPRSSGLPYPPQHIPHSMAPSAEMGRGMRLPMPGQAGPSMSYEGVAGRDPTHSRSVGPSSPLERSVGRSSAGSSHELSPTSQLPTWPAGRTDILSPPPLSMGQHYTPPSLDPRYYSQAIRVPGAPGGFPPSPRDAQFSPQYQSSSSSNTSHDPVRDPYHSHNQPPR